MLLSKKHWMFLIYILCLATCIGDVVITSILAGRYPGYSHVTDTISALGATASPVGNLMSAWWIVIGFVFIIFAIGFNVIYREKGRTAKIASMLFAVYGLGEGFGSGLFKADRIGDSLTVSGKIHDILGGFGVLAMIILPLIIRSLFTKKDHYSFYVFSTAVFYIGLLTTLLFLFR